MIEINLLPEEFKRREPRFARLDLARFNAGELPILKILAAAAGVPVIVSTALFLIGIYAKSNLSSLERTAREITPARKEAEVLQARVDTINKKVTAIDDLMVKRFGWAKKLDDLSGSVTPGIWLTELSYTEKMVDRSAPLNATAVKAKPGSGAPKKNPPAAKTVVKHLVLSGYASGSGEDVTALVGKFIKSLKDNEDFYSDFGDIELGAIKRDKIEDQEVMNFKITCLFKETK